MTMTTRLNNISHQPLANISFSGRCRRSIPFKLKTRGLGRIFRYFGFDIEFVGGAVFLRRQASLDSSALLLRLGVAALD